MAGRGAGAGGPAGYGGVRAALAAVARGQAIHDRRRRVVVRQHRRAVERVPG